MKGYAVIFLALCTVATVAADDEKDKAVKAEREKLKGKWKHVSSESGGKVVEIPDAEAAVVTIDGDKWTVERKLTIGKQNPKSEYTFAIDPSKTPKHFDLIQSDGKGGTKTQQSIYKIEKDTLTICSSGGRGGGDKEERPTEFKTSPRGGGGGGVIQVYKRVEN